MLSMLSENFSIKHTFSKKTGNDISCKLSLKESVCMECQTTFSGKNEKSNVNFPSANLSIENKKKTKKQQQLFI